VNFLAHTLFANGDAERIAGQFCGDFVRGSDLSHLPEGIQQGIARHRRIDAFTDQHRAVKECQALFQPPLRRFAGIITDVVFDHVLATSWSQYSDVALPDHVDAVHDALNEQRTVLPADLQRFATFLQKENVLLGNLEYSGVERTLAGLSRRSERFAPMAQGAAAAMGHMDAISGAFHEFFPELLAIERKIDG